MTIRHSFCLRRRAGAAGMLATIAWVILGLSSPAHALEADTDVEGSADFPLLKRFPYSHIVRYESTSAVKPYTLVLGSIKDVNNIVSPERARQIDGLITRITYRIPDGKRSDQVFDFFREQLVNAHAEILFQCRGLDCGGSNNWANRIFRIAMLYGPEQFQNYLAARCTLEGREQFVALYTLQRGNKRLYAHMEVIAPAADTGALTERAQIIETLRSSGRFPLVGVDFDSGGKLTADARRVLDEVARVLHDQKPLRLFVVGHLAREGALDDAVAASRSRAAEVVRYLVGRGMDPAQLTAAGVGPLAPTAGLGRDRIELVSVE